MRNQPKPLNFLDHERQRLNLAALQDVDKPVTLVYTKRNGTESSSTGVVTFFNGKPGYDTGSVTIETEDKGPRTINLHTIHTIRFNQ